MTQEKAVLLSIMNNLFVSYDSISLVQRYDKVIEAIKSLGGWAVYDEMAQIERNRFQAENLAFRTGARVCDRT